MVFLSYWFVAKYTIKSFPGFIYLGKSNLIENKCRKKTKNILPSKIIRNISYFIELLSNIQLIMKPKVYIPLY